MKLWIAELSKSTLFTLTPTLSRQGRGGYEEIYFCGNDGLTT